MRIPEQADKARQQLAELAPDNQQAAVPGQSIISQERLAADETAAGSERDASGAVSTNIIRQIIKKKSTVR